MKSPKLPAKGKARVMYATRYKHPHNRDTLTPIYHAKIPEMDQFPVAVASLSPEACEARVEAGAKVLCKADYMATWTQKRGYRPHDWRRANENVRHYYRAKARAVLASAGLISDGKKGAGK